jgi:hypothetical protein
MLRTQEIRGIFHEPANFQRLEWPTYPDTFNGYAELHYVAPLHAGYGDVVQRVTEE